MVARSARRREQLDLARSLRGAGGGPAEVAAALRDRYGLGGLLAMRLAHGWTQAEVASTWNARWPDDTRTFKNVSYWENWPGPTGYAPSLAVLDRLAALYSCDVADLVAGWGEHGTGAAAHPGGVEQETLAWQVDHLDLHELTRALDDWSRLLPEGQRRALLLKLSTAAAVAGSASSGSRGGHRHEARPLAMAGRWASSYRYESEGRAAEFEGRHVVDLRLEEGRLVGRSVPQPSGTVLDVALTVEGTVATGTWTERTSPTGYYRAATYHGLLQLVVDPTGRSMSGRWLGLSKRFTVKSGPWRLDWTDQVEASGQPPVTTATTVSPAATVPSAISANTPNIILPT